jgi:hypothetical protein
LAIKGKFITTYKGYCGTCGRTQAISARSAESTSEIRTELICPTEGCLNVLERRNKKTRQTKGGLSNRQPFELFRFANGEIVELEEYECDVTVVGNFRQAFADVWNRIPRIAADEITSHWQTGRGSPHVWILKDRSEWKGKGWAATSPSGLSLYFVSLIVENLNIDQLKTLIAHELGHTLFIALREPNHVPPAKDPRVATSPELQSDGTRKINCEWLVWQLMENWGFDQTALEVHMKRRFIDDSSGVRLSETPDESSGEHVRDERERIALELKGCLFPKQYEKYLVC